MLKTSDGLYINIHEAALTNYPSMQLHVNRSTFGLSSNLVPHAIGVNASLQTIKKAAQYNVMIAVHEPVRPTGLSRTYLNFIASEAGRGNEWNAFSDGSPAEHQTILPFTRLMGGPIDTHPAFLKKYFVFES